MNLIHLDRLIPPAPMSMTIRLHARLLDHSDSSDDSDNVPLAQLLLQG